uniref:Uncharacterized protein n=1 Tax=Tanacetum cinerariifolium TaxID=118510 RepID=A0A699HXY2_TANCI|nr:hypothetical protein [Tanacetum cinerariifolium]
MPDDVINNILERLPIHEAKGCYPEIDEEDINNWILFLSRKGLKQLTLINDEDHSFSFNFVLPPFDQTYNFGKFLTQCPNLESLDFFSHFYNINETDLAKLRSQENADSGMHKSVQQQRTS